MLIFSNFFFPIWSITEMKKICLQKIISMKKVIKFLLNSYKSSTNKSEFSFTNPNFKVAFMILQPLKELLSGKPVTLCWCLHFLPIPNSLAPQNTFHSFLVFYNWKWQIKKDRSQTRAVCFFICFCCGMIVRINIVSTCYKVSVELWILGTIFHSAIDKCPPCLRLLITFPSLYSSVSLS